MAAAVASSCRFIRLSLLCTTGDIQAEIVQAIGGFETQQTTANHYGTLTLPGEILHEGDIIEGAKGHDTGQAVSPELPAQRVANRWQSLYGKIVSATLEAVVMVRLSVSSWIGGSPQRRRILLARYQSSLSNGRQSSVLSPVSNEESCTRL